MRLKDIPLKPKGKPASEFMLEMRELLVGREFISNSGDRLVVKEYEGSKKIHLFWPEHGTNTVVHLDTLRKGMVRPVKTNNARGRVDLPPPVNETLKRCIEKHGDKYDYSQTNFGFQKDRITIRCIKHNHYFTPLQSEHTAGVGICPICNLERASYSFEEWLGRLEDTTNYTSISVSPHGEWVGYRSVVEFRCHRGHSYTKRAAKVKCIADCPTCLQQIEKPLKEIVPEWNKRRNKEQHINRRKEKLKQKYLVLEQQALKQFDGKYQYNMSELLSKIDAGDLSTAIEVGITCDCGNSWYRTFSYHMASNYGKGVGCPLCAEWGYNYKNGSWLYLLTSDDGMFKVGITKDLEQRVRQIHKNSVRKWSVFWCKHLSGDLRPVEKQIKEYLDGVYQKPSEIFDGSTESYLLGGNSPPVFFLKNFV